MKRITAHFDTRRNADLTLEHLVQEHGIERADIVLQAAGEDNTSGERIGGADQKSGDPGREQRADAPLHGPIELCVDVDDDRTDVVCAAVRETGAMDVSIQ